MGRRMQCLCFFVASAAGASFAEDPKLSAVEQRWRDRMQTGNRLYLEGKHAAAEQVLREALKFATSGLGEKPEAATLHALGQLADDQGRCADARSNYLRALAIWNRLAPTESGWWLKTNSNLIGLYIECGDLRSAERLLNATLPQMERLASDAGQRFTLLTDRASIAHSHGDDRDAAQFLLRSVAILEEQTPPDNVRLAVTASSLAVVYAGLERLEEARAQSERALELFERELGTEHVMVGRALNNVACVYTKLRRAHEAVPLFRRGIAIAEAALGPDHPFTAQMMWNYSVALRQSDRADEAKAVAAEAKKRSRSGMQAGFRQSIDIQELRLGIKK